MYVIFVSIGFSVDMLNWYWGMGLRNPPPVLFVSMGCKRINILLPLLFFPQDINGKLFLPKYALSQDVCTYRDFLYKTVEIPGCPHHVTPYFSYPVAVSCKCGKCNTDYSDCIHEAIKTNDCTKPRKSDAVGVSI